MHTVIREIVIGYRRVSVVEPSNVSCCDQSDPCSSDWFESWNLIVILVLEIISIAVALSDTWMLPSSQNFSHFTVLAGDHSLCRVQSIE